jgi:hypothetical protein
MAEGILRCRWCTDSEVLQEYHDAERGFPVNNDHKQKESPQ